MCCFVGLFLFVLLGIFTCNRQLWELLLEKCLEFYWSLWVLVCVVYVHAHVSLFADTCAQRQRLMLCVFLDCSPPYLLKQGLPGNLQHIGLSGLADLNSRGVLGLLWLLAPPLCAAAAAAPVVVFRQGLTVKSWVAWNSFCRPDWPQLTWIRLLGLRACIAMGSFLCMLAIHAQILMVVPQAHYQLSHLPTQTSI